MESNRHSSDRDGPVDAALLLGDLRADRANLAERLRTPRWLPPGFGLAAAAYVTIPAVTDDRARTVVTIAALVASVILTSGYRRVTGIKLARVGARAWMIGASALAASLILLSVSFGLAAAGLHWFIAACAVTGFALVTWLSAMFTSAAADYLRHGR